MKFHRRLSTLMAGMLLAGAALAAAPQADFAGRAASKDARAVADWVLRSADNEQRPFVIVDKRRARLHVFDAAGRLRGSSPVLLGLSHGDDSVPGIGERPLAEVPPEERTTPAGRFQSEPGHNLGGEDILWVDYEAAVSMHRVRATNPAERRLERLATPTVDDNRISWGCINVPAAFYDSVLMPMSHIGGAPVVYVLPEVRPLREVFLRMFPAAAPTTALAGAARKPARATGPVRETRVAATGRAAAPVRKASGSQAPVDPVGQVSASPRVR